jgi:aminotransferase
MQLAERSKVVEHTWIEDSLKILESHPDTISLGAGEPDFPAPSNVVESAQKFLDKGYTHYAPQAGRHELREALSKKLKKENKIRASPDEIVVTCGSNEAILLSLMSTVDPGDRVAISDPTYPAYRPMIEALSCKALPVRLSEEDGFEMHPEQLEKSVSKKTKVVIINNPSNPTGTVFSKKKLEEIADVIVDKGLVAIVDEAYEKLVYQDAKHTSLASLNGMRDKVITTQTFSKSYSMCGFRIGYAVASEKIIKEVREFRMLSTLSAPTAFQMAAVDALQKSSKYVEKMRKEYDRRRRLMSSRIDEIKNIEHNNPKGAFYIFSKISETGMTSEKFANFILKHAKTIVIPGTEFGEGGEGFVRMSYATSYENIEKAMDRIEKAMSAT